jgi:rhodanese-related sulfurtransferase
VRLVASRKVGRHVTYALADAEVTAFWLQYRDFCAGRLAEFRVMRDALVAQRKARGVVDRDTLQKLIKKGTVALLDLRPELEFDAGHLPGALSCPLEQLADRLKSIPAGKTLVLYCRGPLCLLADIAQEQLAARGITALQFSDGVAEWASAGLPVKRSTSYHSLFQTPKP